MGLFEPGLRPARHDGGTGVTRIVRLHRALAVPLATGCIALILGGAATGAAADPDDGAWPEPKQILVWSPARRLRAFSDYAGIFPTRPIRAGGRAYPLAPAPRDLSALSYDLDGKRYGMDDFARETHLAGFIVVHGGRVLYERYELGNDPSTLWVGYSIAKSVVSLLYGAALADRYVESLDDPVVRYLPRLAGGAYDQVTIEQLLQMSSGVAWNEDYEDPEADVSQSPIAILPFLDYMRALPTAAPPGTRFNYSTGETSLAGAVLRAAIGNNLATYLSHRIWRPFGMEADANWMIGAPGGAEYGGCCISATLRDYARIGLFALAEGTAGDGQRLLPQGWMARSTTPADTNAGYGYFWWLRPDGTYAALGIFGQMIWIDPRSKTVVAMHGAWPRATDARLSAHRWAMVEAIAAALAGRDS